MQDKLKPSSTTEPMNGNAKVTRGDWLNVARDLLISDGISEVKVLTIGTTLGVSRSSFYWYFKSRNDLLAQLLEGWERSNTGIMIRASEKPAASINEALGYFFTCIIDPLGFNQQLDFAVRDWARRDGAVRQVLDRSDTARTSALARMFERHGYAPADADIRARVLYYQQIGYHALELAEPLEERLNLVAGYLYVFSGVPAREQDVEAFKDRIRDLMQSQAPVSGES